MQPRVSVLVLMVMLFATGLASCALDIGDKRLALSLENRHARNEGVPTIIVGPTFLAAGHVAGTGPSVDSDADGTTDTYGPTDIVRISVTFSEQVCGNGRLALTLRTGDGPSVTRHARYCGCGSRDVYFCYRVRPGDRDADGFGILANAISLRTYDGMVPDATHRAVPSQPGHRVDGNLPDITPPSLSGAPGISGNPSIRDIYRRGETIRLTARFTEHVVVDASGGVPTLALQIGDTLHHAIYVGDEASEDWHRVHFEYVVREGDRDDDGLVQVPANGLRVPTGSSIRDMAGNDASLIWSVTSGSYVRIDGR